MSDIYLGDCLEHMAAIPTDSVQLIVTSPPYNIGKEYEDVSPIDVYLSEQASVISECARILKPGGSIVWQVGNFIDKTTKEVVPLDALFWPILKQAGLQSRNRIVWTFGHGLHASRRFSGRHETMLWFTKGSDYVFNLDSVRVPQKYPQKKFYKGPKKGQLSGNPLGKNPGDVWDITNVKHNHPEKTAHPCSFPLELVDRFVLALSNAGDTVYDPFGGSGTTVVSAVRNGRVGLMSEIDSDYVAIATQRLASV